MIGGNGTTGTYGALSYCSPAIKLSYAMSAYYEFNPVQSSCDFGGNATFAPNRESSLPIRFVSLTDCSAKYGSRRLECRRVMSLAGTVRRSVHPVCHHIHRAEGDRI